VLRGEPEEARLAVLDTVAVLLCRELALSVSVRLSVEEEQAVKLSRELRLWKAELEMD